MDIHQDLQGYMEKVLGERPRLAPVPADQLRELPMYLRSAYRFERTRLGGVDFVLAFLADRPSVTVGEYARHVRALEEKLGGHVALVLPPIPAYKRNRLVQKRVPFVVPQQQLFLPSLFMDLRERTPQTPQAVEELSPSTQVVVLYYLLGNEVHGVPLQDLARTLGYTSMTMTNVHRELAGAGLGTTVRQGRTAFIGFALPRRDLWKATLEKMRNPVQASYWVQWTTPPEAALEAGLSALAVRTHLGDDPVPTFALSRETWSQVDAGGQTVVLPEPDDADAKVEVWRYDPCILSEGLAVDPLSLYLSLRDSSDERVLAAIDDVIGAMQW